MTRKKSVKYKRKSKKNGKPSMSSKRKWLISLVGLSIIILGALILFIFIKPGLLEGILNNNQDASIKSSASSKAKETDNNPGSASTTTASTNYNSQAGARVSLSGTSTTDYSSYYANLPNILSQSQMVQDIPNGETILIRFYNFDTGYREFEKSFILTKGNAKQGFLDNPEITIVIHSKYLPEINSNNICQVINKADANNDVGVYTDLSTTKIIVKFSSMMEYKDCLM